MAEPLDPELVALLNAPDCDLNRICDYLISLDPRLGLIAKRAVVEIEKIRTTAKQALTAAIALNDGIAAARTQSATAAADAAAALGRLRAGSK